jgi:NADH-quinone oxidoreductase subunit J
MDETLLRTVLFYTLAVLTGASAIAVVVTQNIVRSATWLLFTLAGVAGLFFLLGTEFVGAIQLLIYVGGTLVLVVFGVMLTAQGPFITMRISAAEWALSLVVGVLLFAVLAYSVGQMPDPAAAERERPKRELEKLNKERAEKGLEPLPPPPAPRRAASKDLGAALLGDERVTPSANLTGLPETAKPRGRTPMGYLLPFEIVSVHLLVVLIGAAYLARAKRRLQRDEV